MKQIRNTKIQHWKTRKSVKFKHGLLKSYWICLHFCDFGAGMSFSWCSAKAVWRRKVISLKKFPFEKLKYNFSISNNFRRRSTNETETSASDRTQRLGSLTTAYGNSLGGFGSYGGVGTGYGKPSIDLGGVVLGTLIGIGALLILPKIIGVFSGHGGGASGGYYRSKFPLIKARSYCLWAFADW